MRQILEFPIYLLTNHADWNEAGWTIIVIATLVPLVDLAYAAFKWCIGEENKRWVPTVLSAPGSVRAYVLQLGLWAWTIASLQILTQLLIAQSTAHFGYEFFVTLFLVLLLGNGAWWLLTVVIFRAHLYDMGCYSSPWWAPL